jgi:hypothetical protein
VVRRHEVLRTTFSAVDGQPVQVISPAKAISLPVIDLSVLEEPGRQSEAQFLGREEGRRPFDLSRGPLLRILVLRLSANEHVVLLTMHHIVSDGWSMNLLVQEMATLYQAYSRGDESPLPELAVQYADYAAWQREWLQGEVLEEQLRYWREQLAGELPVLELPTDFPRPLVQSHEGSVVGFNFSPVITEGLRRLSRRESATMFMTMLAAFSTLLSRYSAQSEVIIGTDIAGRDQFQTESLIGFFINQLVLRVNLTGAPTFGELLQRVRQLTLQA